MSCFVILLLSNEMQMSVRRFSAIPHLRAILAFVNTTWYFYLFLLCGRQAVYCNIKQGP